MIIKHDISRKIRTLALGGALFTLLTATSSFAQVPDTATSTADPGRIQDSLVDRGIAPILSERVEVKEIKLQEAPAGSENIIFELKNVNLEGVTVYEAGELEAVYSGKFGTQVSLSDVYGFASALTTKYRNDGYILTQVVVPPQTIEGGNIKLRVVEGFIENITVEGDEDESSLRLIQEFADGIERNMALNIEDLERHLLIIGDLPGVDARSVLSPSTATTGAADLKIILSRDPHDAYVSADNYGSRYLGPIELSAAGSLNSFFGNNERISAQMVVAPDPGTDTTGDLELGYYALSYQQPLPFWGIGTDVELLASYTNTAPGYDLKTFDVRGISKYVSAKVSHPFVRSRSKNLTAHVKFDARNVKSSNNVQATLSDNIRAVRAGGEFQAMDKFFGLGISSLSVEFSKGLDFLGASDRADANKTRTLGDPAFTKITAEAERLQRLSPEVNLFVAAEGQWSEGPLLSSEEFGVGGANFGRGFDSSEIIGDEGVAGKVELQWNNPYDTDIFKDYQLFGFYDIGRTWNKDATTRSQKEDTAASTGFGIRAEFLNEIKTDLYVAMPLNREVQTHGDKGPRFFFKLSRSF